MTRRSSLRRSSNASAATTSMRLLGGWVSLCVLCYSPASAAQSLIVVEVSPEDAPAADKLQELVQEPFERRSATPEQAADASRGAGCPPGVRFELVLDGAHAAVRLVRCRDGTIMTRTLDPNAARDTPYLEAFVAAELLALNAELETVVIAPREPVRTATSPETSLQSPQPPAATPQPSAATPRGRSRWRLGLGAQWLAVGKLFDGALRPQLDLGLAVGSDWPRLAWLLEVNLAILAHGKVGAGTEAIDLTRNDAQLRAGLVYASDRWSLLAFGLGRASLTSASHAGVATATLRWGLGAGAEIDVALLDWAYVYGNLVADLATSRSDYRVNGMGRARDPAVVLTCSLGVLLMGWL